MSIPGILLLIGMIAFLGWIIYSACKNIDAYNAIPSFQEYRSANPELVDAGKVICSKCSGRDKYLKNIGEGLPTVNFHICRTCGTTLYKTLSQ